MTDTTENNEYSVETRHAKWLAEQDFEHAVTLTAETAAGLRDGTTGAILRELTDGPRTPTQLDDALEADAGVVDNGLADLFAASLIGSVEGQVSLKADYVFVRPLVFDGEVVGDE